MQPMLQGLAVVWEGEGISLGGRMGQGWRNEGYVLLYLLNLPQNLLRRMLGAETVRWFQI